MDEMTADKVNSQVWDEAQHAQDAMDIEAMLDAELRKLRLVCECVGHEWVTVDSDGHRVCGRCGVEL